MNERIQKLKSQIEELKAWKASLLEQQFQLPLGTITRNIVKENRMVKLEKQNLAPVYDISLEASFHGIVFWISASTQV